MASAIPDPPLSSTSLNNGGASQPPSGEILGQPSPIIFPNPATSISTINIPITTKLNKTNFLTWKSQLLPIIHGYNLSQFLNSSAPNPSLLSSSGQVQFNPDYLPWVRQDQLLLGWMRSSLTEQVQAQVIACSTSAELWSTLQKQFSATSRARLIELKRQLQNTTKGAGTCSDFLDRIRHIADELSFIGSPISDDDLCLAVLNGLGTDFNPFFAAIQATCRHDSLSFDELHRMLLSFESLVLAQQTPATISQPTAFFSAASTQPYVQRKKNTSGFQPRNNMTGPRPPPFQTQPIFTSKNSGPQFPPKVSQNSFLKSNQA